MGKQNDQYTWKAGTDNRLVFGQKQDIAKLKELLNESTTFDQMGFTGTVSLGPISWKKNVEFLTDNPQCPRFIYNSDLILGNKLILGDPQKADKKRYFDAGKAKRKAIKGPFVVVNRGDRSGTYN